MKEKTLHVVNGSSICSNVKRGLEYLGSEDEIICQPHDFSIGYIPKDFSDKEFCIALRRYMFLDDSKFITYFEEWKQFFSKDFSVYDKVVVWHGGAAFELLLLYLMSVLTEGNLYHIDIKDCEAFMNKYPGKSNLYVGYVSPYDISQFNMLSFVKKVSENEHRYYKEQWYRWANSKSPYRFSNMYTGIIQEYNEDFMDTTIYDYARKFPKLRTVVGKVFSKFEELYISDSIVIERIIKLCFVEGNIKLYTDVVEENKQKL